MKTKTQPQKRVRGHWTTAPTVRSRKPNPAAAFNAGERKFLYISPTQLRVVDEHGETQPCCPACKVEYLQHAGLIPTCERLQAALGVLRQVAELPPRCSRRATALAESCLVFLEACEQERQKNNKQKAKLK